MLKNFLKRWGPILMFFVVLIGFGAHTIFFKTMVDPKTEPEITSALSNSESVKKALNKREQVTPGIRGIE